MDLHYQIGIVVLLASFHGAAMAQQVTATVVDPAGASEDLAEDEQDAPDDPAAAEIPGTEDDEAVADEEAPDPADAADPCAVAASSLSDVESFAGQDPSIIEDCHDLAVAIRTVLSERFIQNEESRTAPPPWAPDAPAGAGTPSQLAAAPAATPVPLLGGAASFVGTASGPRLVAALSLNPGALGASAANDHEDLVLWSRLVDVAVVLPLTIASDVTTGNAIDFFGVRLRVNALAPVSAETAREQMRRLEATGPNEAELDQELTSLLRTADDPAVCARALLDAASDGEPSADVLEAVDDACDGDYPEIARHWQDVETALDDIDEQVRREADRYYLGLDLRYDYGDTTLTGNVQASHASTVLAALSLGARVVNDRGVLLRLRGRAGVQYSHVPSLVPMDADLDPISLDGAAALEIEIPLNQDLFRINVGVEGRGIIGAEQDVAPMTTQHLTSTDYCDLRFGTHVPFGSGPGVGVDISVPLIGSHPVQVAVTGDFSLFAR